MAPSTIQTSLPSFAANDNMAERVGQKIASNGKAGSLSRKSGEEPAKQKTAAAAAKTKKANDSDKQGTQQQNRWDEAGDNQTEQTPTTNEDNAKRKSNRDSSALPSKESKKRRYEKLIQESKQLVREMEGVRDSLYRESIQNAILLDFLAMQGLDEEEEMMDDHLTGDA